MAIVGRPNVGKSTLFNRLVGRRSALVHDEPGVTRDRVFGRMRFPDDRQAMVVDTGGLVVGDDPLGMNRQVLLAMEEADVLVLVVDGKEGLVPGDLEVSDVVRKTGKPSILVVNKGDTRAARDGEGEFYQLGLAPQILLSAEHGVGIESLRDALSDHVPERGEDSESEMPRLAVVGRPNVGKSSLLNRLADRERSLVSDQPGTTRDPVDSIVRVGERDYRMIDTAGIRRRSRTSGVPEALAVMMAKRQLEVTDLAILVIDASAGVTSGDLAIADAVQSAGRGAVVAVNKWDLLETDSRRQLEDSWPRLDTVLAEPLRVNLSALTGRGVDKLFPAVDETLAAYRTQLATAEVNRMLERLVAAHHAPAQQGAPWKFYYATQVSTGPPTFMLFANRKLPRNSPYRRYLENAVRRELALPGVPVRLLIRPRKKGEKG